MSSLRLAVDARVVAEDRRGIGRYVRAILQRLIARDDVELTLLAYGPFAFRHRGAFARALGSARFAVRSRVGRDVDVVWHAANGTFFPSHARSVVSIQDVAPFRFPVSDLQRREREQEPFRRSARTATRVITGSQFARDEIRDVLRVPPERIDVIHHAVESAFSPGSATGLPGGVQPQRYLLFIGPIDEPRKNFELLHEGYRRAWPGGTAPGLVVLGPHAPSAPGIVHVKDLAEEGVRALYRGAIALVMPSRYEGFGLPILEARACGTPVIAADAPPLPEVGGAAALYAPANDADAWAQALRRIVAEPELRDRLRIAGLARAAQFDWNDSAAKHLAVFRAVAP